MSEKLRSLGVETLAVTEDRLDPIRLYFRIRPARVRLATDEERNVHRAYGRPMPPFAGGSDLPRVVVARIEGRDTLYEFDLTAATSPAWRAVFLRPPARPHDCRPTPDIGRRKFDPGHGPCPGNPAPVASGLYCAATLLCELIVVGFWV